MGRKNGGPKFYAVRVGRRPGISSTWPDCEAQVKGFSKAKFAAFETREQAELFAELDVPFLPATPATPSPSLQSTRLLVKDEGRQPRTLSQIPQVPQVPSVAPASLMPPPPPPAAPSAPRGRKRKVYAVAIGARPGIYFDWDYCSKQVVDRPGSVYKGLSTPQEALQFIRDNAPDGASAGDLGYYATFMPTLRTGVIFTNSDFAFDTPEEHAKNNIYGFDTLEDADNLIRRELANLPRPMEYSYFSQFQDFKRIPSSQFDDEFAVLASSQGIDPGTKAYSKARTKAIGHEFLFYYGPLDPDTQEPIDPVDLTVADKLRIYQAMCRDVGIDSRDTIGCCIDDLKTKVLVNIVDFIDARRLKKPVRTWPLEHWHKFAAYTLQNGKRLHLESAKEYGGFLQALLQDFRHGPGAHVHRKRDVHWLEEPVLAMKRARVF